MKNIRRPGGERGVAMIEYALLAALIAVSIWAVITFFMKEAEHSTRLSGCVMGGMSKEACEAVVNCSESGSGPGCGDTGLDG